MVPVTVQTELPATTLAVVAHAKGDLRLEDVPLPPAYAVFGQVTDGMDVVDAIAALPTRGETPAQTVFVESVRVA